jgi:hypothetical protein
MVSWFSPKQLELTTFNVAISIALLKRADIRMMQLLKHGAT